MRHAITVGLVVSVMSLLLAATPARGAETEQSLLVEAVVLLRQADAAADPERQAELLLEARERLRRIVSEHAGGVTARQLAGTGVPVAGGEPIALYSVERRICAVAPAAIPTCDDMDYEAAATFAEALQTAAGIENAGDARVGLVRNRLRAGRSGGHRWGAANGRGHRRRAPAGGGFVRNRLHAGQIGDASGGGSDVSPKR